MPTISIRSHGMSASKWQQLVDPKTGEPIKLTSFRQPERTNCGGWTRNVARRNEQRLQQIDFDAIEGVPAFITLTMPARQIAEVSARKFHCWLNSWLVYMRRRGCIHYYWILEFQGSGNPHLHVIVWLVDWRTGGAKRGRKSHSWVGESGVVERYRALVYWVKMLNGDGIAAKVDAQNFQLVETGSHMVDGEVLELATPERLLMYLAKHAARGVAHYQRQIENMPDDWKYSSGRMWAHDRALPLKEQQDFECSYRTFWRYRRLVRRWRCSEARAIVDPERRRAAVVQARRCLRCPNPVVSQYRGISAWIPQDVSSRLLDVAMKGGDDCAE